MAINLPSYVRYLHKGSVVPYILPFLSLFLSNLIFASDATVCKFDFNYKNHEVTVYKHIRSTSVNNNQNSTYQITLPQNVINVKESQNYLYILENNHILIINCSDLTTNSNDNANDLNLIKYQKKNLNSILNNRPVLDMSVITINNAAIIYFSFSDVKHDTNNHNIEIKAVAIELNPIDNKSSTQELSLFNNFKILGNGPIATTKDHRNNYNLYSLDYNNNLLHHYQIDNLFNAKFQNSYPLKLRTDHSSLKNRITLDQIMLMKGTSANNLYLLNKKINQKFTISLTQLQAYQEISRYHFLINWNNEIGNIWTKQLLALGSLSSLIDSLDQYYGNASLDLEKIKGQNIIPLLGEIDRKEIFEWLESSNLFTEQEIHHLDFELNQKTIQGQRWFITIAIITATFTYLKIKTPKNLSQEKNAITEKLYHFAIKAMKRVGIKGSILDDMAKNIAKQKFKRKGRLLRNYYNNKHPRHLIEQLEKDIKKLQKNGYKTATNSIKAKGLLKQRANKLIKYCEEL